MYQAAADIQSGELDAALNRVRQGESSQPFLDYARHRDFWVGYFRETHADQFNAMKVAYEAQVLEVHELYPDDNPDPTSMRIMALEHIYKNNERNLIESLTNRAGLEQPQP
ncbi:MULTISPECIES: NEL domain-containing protein [Pseudomonas]|uniref:NEL domain-containing protein n=1 Tax=Pseudomonas TaxID=286 RepID=UPI00211422F5|nr:MULTISPECIES: NEL domain-containing protein [Pseudomonas]